VYLSILHALFPLLDLALGYVKEFFFFNNRELCTSCYYRFISDQLLVLPARRLSLSLKPTQAFLFFQLIELSDFLFVSELVSLSARDSRNSL
jgi:hypothetical protein